MRNPLKSKPAPDPVLWARVTDLEGQLARARERIADLVQIEEAFILINSGDVPPALRFLQRKCVRQRQALRRKYGRMATWRFQVRTLNRLGRGLTRDEYLKARAEEPEALQKMIEEEQEAQ
jgi:hypothetical protein